MNIEMSARPPSAPDASAAAPAHDPDRLPGRPRSAEADRSIVEATLELLADRGLAAVSIEAVAAAAGVGKTTIYRRWANKDALVCGALTLLNDGFPRLGGESVRDDLVTCIDFVRVKTQSSLSGRLMPVLVASAAHNPELMQRYHEVVLEPRRSVLRQVLRRGVESGELRADLDPDLVEALLVGPMLHSLLLCPDRRQRATRRTSERLVDAVLAGVTPR